MISGKDAEAQSTIDLRIILTGARLSNTHPADLSMNQMWDKMLLIAQQAKEGPSATAKSPAYGMITRGLCEAAHRDTGQILFSCHVSPQELIFSASESFPPL